MKKIKNIAALELSAMFYSPIAWLVLVVFTVHSGILFSNALSTLFRLKESGWQYSYAFTLFTSPDYGFYIPLYTYIFLYVPFLTMGVFSREINNGSIRLLLAAPLRISEIVLGKLLAAITACACLVLILLVYVVIARFYIVSMDMGYALTGLLGFFLMFCAYAAVGVFVSSLTSYQVIAAIGPV